MLVNVPALITLNRSYLAELRGDAEETAALAARALAESHEGEWMLSYDARTSGRGRVDSWPARCGRARLHAPHCQVA